MNAHQRRKAARAILRKFPKGSRVAVNPYPWRPASATVNATVLHHWHRARMQWLVVQEDGRLSPVRRRVNQMKAIK